MNALIVPGVRPQAQRLRRAAQPVRKGGGGWGCDGLGFLA
jgi:hypothetical protein